MKKQFLLLGLKNFSPPMLHEARDRLVEAAERKTGLPTFIYNADFITAKVVSKNSGTTKKHNRNL